jgi:hypothetical protein
MIGESRSLTVQFFEEDEEIWEILENLSEEQRNTVIKEALGRYIKENPGTRLQSKWEFDSLFVAGEVNKSLEMDDPDLSEKAQSLHINSLNNPLQHLFEIIGEEEDEDVIQFLRADEHPISNSKNFETSLEKGKYKEKEQSQLNDLFSLSENIEPAHQKTDEEYCDLKKSNGLDFILQQVIGEEDDEAVLQFFKEIAK